MKRIVIQLTCIILLFVCCVDSNDSKIGDNKLRFKVDKTFFLEVDTSNWQYIYEEYKIINFNRKYFIDVFSKSSKSCLYCVVNTENNIIVPLPIWSCNVNFNEKSDIVVIQKDSTEIKYQFNEDQASFVLID